MDSKLFRLPSKPDFYAGLEGAAPVDIRSRGAEQELPAPDSRFPGWAAPMSDARLVTDYRPHCAVNIPAGKQFPTKNWMQRNAEEIRESNRRAYAQRMGGFLPYDASVVPPPALVVTCKAGGCARETTGATGGIGMERADAACPELFGTFSFRPTDLSAPAAQPAITTRAEGGRNTVRGRF
jgi:hypothetical protein